MPRKPTPTPLDSYPQCHTHDGIDTSRAHKTGWKDNALVIEKPVTTWRDSKTGEPVAPPDYARDMD